MFLTEVGAGAPSGVGAPRVPALRLSTTPAKLKSTTPVPPPSVPRGATAYSLSSHAGAVASRSPSRARPSVVHASPAPPPARDATPGGSTSARSLASSRARHVRTPADASTPHAQLHQQRLFATPASPPAALQRPTTAPLHTPAGAPYHLGDDAYVSSDDEYYEDAVVACLPSAAHPHLAPSINLALPARPEAAAPAAAYGDDWTRVDTHLAMGALTVREFLHGCFLFYLFFFFFVFFFLALFLFCLYFLLFA